MFPVKAEKKDTGYSKKPVFLAKHKSKSRKKRYHERKCYLSIVFWINYNLEGKLAGIAGICPMTKLYLFYRATHDQREHIND
jgi:hypothetical protein